MSAVRKPIQATPTIGGRVGAVLLAAIDTLGAANTAADKAIRKVLANFMHCILRGMLHAVKPNAHEYRLAIPIGNEENRFSLK
jgi:hypothetical protein